MRLLILALFGLLVASFATSSNSFGVPPILELTEGYIRVQTDGGSDLSISDDDKFQCSASKPCIDGACCNSDGHCGYRPEHCKPNSPAKCVANCDAKAPCGQFSDGGKKTCPLGLCCSYFGFCGASDVFCRSQTQEGTPTPCESNCDKWSTATCDKNSAKRRITYFQASNMRRRDCDQSWPGRLNTTGFTHIFLSFAVLDPKTFAVSMQHPNDEETYKQFLQLPDSISKGLAIGGWDMSNDGPARTAWSDMSSTKSNRKAFIDSLKQFLQKWKFSAVELHWEWPGSSSRGGNPSDTQNQVDLVYELRDSLGRDFGISVVLPPQYEYLKNMDPLRMQDVLDWFTVLTYDLHGPWDASVNGLGPKIKPHTDLAEIDSALDLLRAAQIKSTKINMGIANYGRGFTVADQVCKYYGCKFTGPSNAGSCTKEDGLLSACEIKRIIRKRDLTPHIIPGGAGVKEITWQNQWIGYDDDETFGMKLDLANKRCLGGTSLWAIDYHHCDGQGGIPGLPGSSAEPVPLPSTPLKSTQPVPSNPPSLMTSGKESAIPQPPSSPVNMGPSTDIRPSSMVSIPPNAPSHASSHAPPIAPSDGASHTKSAQGSISTSSIVQSSQTASQVAPSRSDTPSSWKGSATPSPTPSNNQPSSQAGPTFIAPIETTSSAQGSSLTQSYQAWNSQQSSVPGSSGFMTSGPVSSAHGSTSGAPVFNPTTSGASSWPIQPSNAPSSVVSLSTGTALVPGSWMSGSSMAGSATTSAPAGASSFWSSNPSGFGPSNNKPFTSTDGSPVIPSWGSFSRPSDSATSTDQRSSAAGSPSHPTNPPSTAPFSQVSSSSYSPQIGSSTWGVPVVIPGVPLPSTPEVSSPAPGAPSSQTPMIPPSTAPERSSPAPIVSSPTPGSSSWRSPVISSISVPGVSLPVPVVSPPAPGASSSPAPTNSLSPTQEVSSSASRMPSSAPGASPSRGPIPPSLPAPGVSSPMPVKSSPVPGSSAAVSSNVSSQAPPPVTNGSSAVNSSGHETLVPKPTSAQGSSSLPKVTPNPVSATPKPSPTATGCPQQCRDSEWCKIFCEDWLFPRPDDVQPPHECLLPDNVNWCRPWWWGAPTDNENNDGDPDSHSDSDPDCKPNDCVAECIKWRLITFMVMKRPVCPCVPKKCDKGSESDSPSDSDSDNDHHGVKPPNPNAPNPDPKPPKPKPTSHPKEKNPKCKLFGCGCGWMGLNFGPGCPGLEIDLNIPCGIFGCNPCIFFGCPGGTQPDGIVGYGGYCPGGGCDPCPPELCSRPGCTLSGGCGPKPGPAPTRPPNRLYPNDCDDNKRTVITERFVWCTEGFNVSALPSSIRGTSSTMISSLCIPMIDATVTACAGAIPGFDTTTTATGTKTLTSDAPACTRAPLSLDDDEGNNIIRDPLNTSHTFASNTTIKHSKTHSKTQSTTVQSISTSMQSTSIQSTSTQSTKTSFALPEPTWGYMDRNGHWKVNISQFMVAEYSEIKWTLIDPNGNHAGEHQVKGNNMQNMTDKIQSINRPAQHRMAFEIDMTVSDPRNVDKCRVSFLMTKNVPGCDFFPGAGCRPYMTTESFTEEVPFAVQVCEEECKKHGKKSPLASSDLWCQDLNDADWEPEGAGWKRNFQCGWKGF